MFSINKSQETNFTRVSFKKYEDDMVEHVKEFFPDQFSAMQDPVTRLTIRYGYERAKKYGLGSVRNACLYLNAMLALGSNFDVDPQYPWAGEILNDVSEKNAGIRADALTDKVMEVYSHLTGAENGSTSSVFVNLTGVAPYLLERALYSPLKDVHLLMMELHPEKCKTIGETNLHELAMLATVKASWYRMTNESHTCVLVLLMFLLGAGFDKDPQLPWTEEILKDNPMVEPGQKARRLVDQFLVYMNRILNPSPEVLYYGRF